MKKENNQTGYLLIAIGLVLFIAGAYSYAHQPGPPKLSKQAKAVQIATAPSSVKPKAVAIAAYTVAPTLPKYISIPSIGIGTTRIIQLGLLSNGQIATPDNIYDTGWFNQSAQPGQYGAMFIYGHVSSWTADGIFYNLKKLKPGSDVTIIRGDNTFYIYRVVTTKIYPYNNVPMSSVLAPIQSGTPGLNLMTCTGSVIKGTSEFNERLVVYTSLVSR